MAILGKTPPLSMRWPSTRFSIIGPMGDRDDPLWSSSWAHLAEAYQRTMKLYVRRRLANAPSEIAGPQDAEDVVQEFIAVCMRRNWLSNADLDKGKFRMWVQVLLRSFTEDWVRKRMAKKRYPSDARRVMSLLPDDTEDGMPHLDPTEIEEFDHSWTDVAVGRALKRMRDKCPREHAVIVDRIHTGSEGSKDMHKMFDVSPTYFSVIKYRAKEYFCKYFKEELRDTVDDPTAFAEEWARLQPYMP